MIEPPEPAPPALDPAAVRGIVFDLDGTLVDSYGPITTSLNHARQAFGLPALELSFVRSRVGRGLETLVSELVTEHDVERGVRLFRECYAEVHASGTRALPGVARTLTALRRHGYRLSVASNKPARFSRPILEACALAGFDAVCGPDVVGTTKPDPRMILACLAAMGLPASAALYVGDMLLDVASAAAAGVPVVLVAGGSSPLEALRATGQPVLHGLSALCPLLGRPPLPDGVEPGINPAGFPPEAGGTIEEDEP